MIGVRCKISNSEVLKACYDENLITIPASDNVIRLLPPLNISDNEINEAMHRLHRVAHHCVKRARKTKR